MTDALIESRHATLDRDIASWLRMRDVQFVVGAGLSSRGHGASTYFFVSDAEIRNRCLAAFKDRIEESIQ